MPHLRIETNVKSSKIDDMKECLSELTEAVAETLEVEEESVFVTIIPDVDMALGGDRKTPAAQATLMLCYEIHNIQNHTGMLFHLIKKHLGVKSDRCNILFIDELSSVGV